MKDASLLKPHAKTSAWFNMVPKADPVIVGPNLLKLSKLELMANCLFPGLFATNPEAPLVLRITPVPLLKLITTFGSGPLPHDLSTQTLFITIGIGSGISVMVILAIRAFIRWILPAGSYPTPHFPNLLFLSGRFGYTDQGETPNTQISFLDFGQTMLVFEVRGLKTDSLMGEKVGNILHFENGTIAGGKFFKKALTRVNLLFPSMLPSGVLVVASSEISSRLFVPVKTNYLMQKFLKGTTLALVVILQTSQSGWVKMFLSLKKPKRLAMTRTLTKPLAGWKNILPKVMVLSWMA